MKTRALAAAMFLVACALFAQTQTATQGQNVPDAEQFVGAPKGQPLTGAALEQQTAETAALLRCPVCQGLSVADSPSEMAVNMKHQVHALHARGFTQEQILAYFERSYGQFVLLKPKFQGVNTLVWIVPILALAIGVVIVMSKMKKLEHEPQPANSETPKPRNPETPTEEDPYLAQVRNLVGGGKK